MASHRWKLYDPVDGVEIRFPINPREGALPALERTISSIATAAPDGRSLIFEGQQTPQEFSFTGAILSKDHYDFMVNWFNKRRQMRVTDDLGNQWWLMLKSFTPSRKRSHSHPWAADYDAVALVLDWRTA